MYVNRVERFIGPKSLGHKQRVTQIYRNGKQMQIGETIENNVVTFREIISKGKSFFRRIIESYGKDGKPIKGSRYVQKLTGEQADNQPIRTFGVIA